MNINEDIVIQFNKVLEDEGSTIRLCFIGDCDSNIANGAKICSKYDNYAKDVRFSVREGFYEKLERFFHKAGVHYLVYSEDGMKFWSGSYEMPKSDPDAGTRMAKIDLSSIGRYGKEIDAEIEKFVFVLSDRHQRSINEIQVSPEIFSYLQKEGRIFKNYFIHFNEKIPVGCRTRQPWLQHIPILINRNFVGCNTGKIRMKW